MAFSEGTTQLPNDGSTPAKYFMGGWDGSKFWALRSDSNKNLQVNVNSPLPAGTNLIGAVNTSQVGGVAVPKPQMSQVYSLPTLATSVSTYIQATQAVNSGVVTLQINFPALAPSTAAALINDAAEAIIVIWNEGTAQTINGAAIGTSDAIGGNAYSATYGLVNANIASGGYQLFRRSLTKGLFSAFYVLVNFAVAPTAGSVGCALVLRPHTSRSGGDFYAGNQNATTAAAKLQPNFALYFTINALSIKNILVQSDPTNTADVYVGSAGFQTLRLQPGGVLTIETNELNNIYVQALSGTQRINYLCEL